MSRHFDWPSRRPLAIGPPKNRRAGPRGKGDRAQLKPNSSSEPYSRPTAPRQEQFLAAARRRREAEAIHRLGARVLAELLDELRRHHPEAAADIDRRVAKYAAADPAVLRALGADRFPHAPVRLIAGSRP